LAVTYTVEELLPIITSEKREGNAAAKKKGVEQSPPFEKDAPAVQEGRKERKKTR